MTYKEWFIAHGNKHRALMQKLTRFSDEEVIAYFRFENMVEKEPDFCLLYGENKKCHDIEDLNCYLCACPHFHFDDSGLAKEREKIVYSRCTIGSKEGATFVSENAIHHDCSHCFVPHDEAYIQKHFSRDWFKIMGTVQNV
ncbi:MAG: hypothetical protein RL113_666 [Pseudomonadota bacterium]|jgi:hypothetical protein